MIKKYMEDLKNDIMVIISESKFIKDYRYLRNGTVFGNVYRVILNNGIEFYIAADSYKFPNFNIDDIAYINKKLNSDSCDIFDSYIDTEIGEYKINSGYYDCLISKLFNVIDMFETGCYEEG